MVTTVGVAEARRTWSRRLGRVSAGGEVVITRRGHPIARMVPAQEPKRSRAELLAEMEEFRRGNPLGGITIRELIDEGRR